MEELASEENYDTDTQGVGIASGTATRFVSDSLRFTGIDLGDRQQDVVRRGRGGQEESEEEDEEDEESSSEEDEEDLEEQLAHLPPREREEALLQSAMHRIERARSRGSDDVRLSKGELAALERHRRRIEEEAKKKRRSKKRRDQRVAVPLTQLEPISRKKRAPPISYKMRQESLPRQGSAGSRGNSQDRQGYPPMGYFAPPSGPTRPRSGTASSQRPASRVRGDRGDGSNEYLQSPTTRHASDGMAGNRAGRSPPYKGSRQPSVSPVSSRSASRTVLDPFQYQIDHSRAPVAGNPAAPSRRRPSGHEMGYMTRPGMSSPALRSSRGSRQLSPDEDTTNDDSEASDDDDSSEEEQEDTSSTDGVGSGAQIREMPRGRRPAIVVEVDAEPEPEPEPEPVRQPTKRNARASPAAPKRKQPARGARRKK